MPHRIAACRNTVTITIVALGACGPAPDSPVQTTEADAMADNAHEHHTIDYIEFSVTDMEEAKRFYSQAFGWEFNDYGPDYAGIRRGDGEAGGFRVVEQVATGGPLIVLYSSDLELTLESVKQAGGRIVQEPFGFPGGRRFHFTDPSGNELAVWSEP